MRTAMQIITFISAVVLIVLCFLQANKGQNVLNGLTNTGSKLFKADKEVGSEKVITIVIVCAVILMMALIIIEGAL